MFIDKALFLVHIANEEASSAQICMAATILARRRFAEVEYT